MIGEEITLMKSIFVSSSGTVSIYDAFYKDEPCYAIVYDAKGKWHAELIDHMDQYAKNVVNKIKRCGAPWCNPAGDREYFKFAGKAREKEVTLRTFIMARYNNVTVDKIRGRRIYMFDNSGVKNGIYDLRSSNLYFPGECRPHTKVRDIDVVDDIILITFHTENGDVKERTVFERELYLMLASPGMCIVHFYDGRGYVQVYPPQFHGKKHKIVTFGRFCLLYKTFFSSYRTRRGPIKTFLRDFIALNDKYSGMDDGHISGDEHDCCFRNMIWMKSETNSEMSNYIQYFKPPYHAYAAVNEANEIVIEYIAPMLGEDKGVPRFFKCLTPEDYAHWQLLNIGHDKQPLFKNLKYIRSADGESQKTTIGMAIDGEINSRNSKDNIPDWEEYDKHTDILLSLPGESFTIHRRNETLTVDDLMRYVSEMYG